MINSLLLLTVAQSVMFYSSPSMRSLNVPKLLLAVPHRGAFEVVEHQEYLGSKPVLRPGISGESSVNLKQELSWVRRNLVDRSGLVVERHGALVTIGVGTKSIWKMHLTTWPVAHYGETGSASHPLIEIWCASRTVPAEVLDLKNNKIIEDPTLRLHL